MISYLRHKCIQFLCCNIWRIGKEDGLYFYRKIIEQADTYLNSGGWLCFEIGYDQGETVKKLLVQKGYENVRIGQDLAGLDRTAFGMKK